MYHTNIYILYKQREHLPICKYAALVTMTQINGLDSYLVNILFVNYMIQK